MIEWVKEHPGLSIGALLAAVAVIVVVNYDGGGSGVVVAQPDPTGSALANSQQEMQYRLSALNAQLQAKAADNATAVELKTIEAQYGYDVAKLSAGVATTQINAEQQTTSLQSTLLAQTQQAGIEADEKKSIATVNAQVQSAALYADAVKTQAAYNAQISTAAIQAASKKTTVWDFLGF